jgi:small basic protein
MIPLFGLLAGIVIGVVLEPSIPRSSSRICQSRSSQRWTRCSAPSGPIWKAYSPDRVFIVSFISNVLIAAAIVYVGDQIGVGSQLATGGRRRPRHPHLHQCCRD